MERRAPAVDLSILQCQELLATVLPEVVITACHPVTHGRVNTNIRLLTSAGEMFLRINTWRLETSAKEVAISELIADSVLAPKLISSGLWQDHHFAIYEFINAPNMLGAKITDWQKLGASIGKTLAAIWSHKFENFGDLCVIDKNLAVKDWGLGNDPVRKFCQHCLFNTKAAERLGADLRDKTWALIKEAKERWPDENHQPNLAHGDFNPTNVLVRDNKIAAVVDWEFAHAGGKYGDLGNLFRQRDEFQPPEKFMTSVVEGLAKSGVDLPEDWFQRTLLSDLTSALEFLSSKQDRPNTHARAKKQVELTLLALAS
ncbi:MAG: aminoglycoside phosphotransferase family protein [Planctomycetota bacterium]